MAFKYQNSNLSNMIYGFGTSTSYGGYDTTPIDSGLRTGGTSMRGVLRNSTFMPFSDATAVEGFSRGGSPIFSAGLYAGVNRFIQSNTTRYSSISNNSIAVIVAYKGGGTYNSLGTLKIGSLEIADCPPVISVYAQGAGGAGGGSRKDGIWAGQSWTGGGGGGSGAFWAFYLQMPFNTSGNFEEVLRYTMNSYVSFSKNGVTFATVGAGGDGQTPTTEFGTRNGGSAGVLSMYSLPSDVRSCCFSSSDGDLATLSFLGGVAGGKGGTGSGPFGAVSESIASLAGGAMPTRMRFYLSSTGIIIPSSVAFTSGSGNSTGGGAGGGGGGSRMGNGGAGASGVNGYSSAISGYAGGIGAGGGGGANGGSGFSTVYNGGAGGSAFIRFGW